MNISRTFSSMARKLPRQCVIKVFVSFSGIAMSVGVASAAVFTDTASGSFTSGLLPINNSQPYGGVFRTLPNVIALSLPGFDTALGTLTGVNYSYNYQFTFTQSTAPNNPVPPMSTDYHIQEIFTAPGANISTFCGAVAGAVCTAWIPMSGRNALFLDVYTRTSPVYSITGSVPGSALASYLSNPVNVALTDPGGLDVLTPGIPFPTFVGGLKIDTTFTTTLSYMYSPVAAPVPEPETYSMMLAGLGMMGFIVRRRRYV